jgi:hypothetical protein
MPAPEEMTPVKLYTVVGGTTARMNHWTGNTDEDTCTCLAKRPS